MTTGHNYILSRAETHTSITGFADSDMAYVLDAVRRESMKNPVRLCDRVGAPGRWFWQGVELPGDEGRIVGQVSLQRIASAFKRFKVDNPSPTKPDLETYDEDEREPFGSREDRHFEAQDRADAMGENHS